MTDPTMTRVSVPALDAIIGHQFPVLDDGFVRLVDYMGGDASIVQAARVSYGAGTKSTRSDRGLIRYLMRHHHTTPFEMAELKIHVRVPMDIWRQWVRHRTASVNEYSTRYSEAIDAAHMTEPDAWRLQASGNRQGSSGYLPAATSDGVPDGNTFTAREEDFHRIAREEYRDRIDAGIAREQARKDLPLSTYTEAYWKCNLHNLLHFLHLRLDPHAQQEIRDYAKVIADRIVSVWVPITWEAWRDYVQDAVTLSRVEIEALRWHLDGDVSELPPGIMGNGEWREWNAKIERIRGRVTE